MNKWGLPECAEFGGVEYTINSDFRDILEIISILQDEERPQMIRPVLALELFYEDFSSIPAKYHQDAAEWMVGFIGLFEEDDGKPKPKQIDWEQDWNMIVSEVNKVAKMEVRATEHLHWWTFIGYFNAVGEGQLSFVVSIRDKLRKGKKLEKYEKDFYRQNRSTVEFKKKITTKEQKLLDEWLK